MSPATRIIAIRYVYYSMHGIKKGDYFWSYCMERLFGDFFEHIGSALP